MKATLAIAQTWMYEGLGDNLAAMRAALCMAAQCGASICIFPELALSGFHRRIGERFAQTEAMAWAQGQLHGDCAQLGIAAAYGLPARSAAGRPLNRYVLIDAEGEIQCSIDKHGLTPSEAQFFVPGTPRGSGLLGGLRCSAVLCREVLDIDPLATAWPPGALDLLLWPSIISSHDAESPDYASAASAMAQRCGVPILQCNWPNSVNSPPTRGLGGSSYWSANGRLLAQAPMDAAGLAVIDSDGHGLHWHPLPREATPKALSA